MKRMALMTAMLALLCATAQAQLLTGVCDPKAPATPCINQPLEGMITITGKAASGASIDVSVDAKKIGSTTAGADGTFQVDVPSLVQCQLVRVDQTSAPKATAGPVVVKVLPPTGACFESLASDQMSIDVVNCPKTTMSHLLVRDTALQHKLKDLNLQKGDRVSVTIVPDKDGQNVLQVLTVRVNVVTRSNRIWTLFCSILALFLLSLLLSWGHPLQLIVGEDGRYSNSKFQMVLWFGIALAAYIATVWLRVQEFGTDFLGKVDIPQNLLLLSGMSAFTFGAAKGITTSKVQDAKDAGLSSPKPAATETSFLSDLTHNDANKLDLGDFQMLVITLLAVASYLLLSFHFLGSLEWRGTVSLPDVDTTILAAFGLGHGAYLTKKAVGPVAQT